MQESPLCDLVAMKNTDKAYTWKCNDFSEEAKLELLAARLQTAESKFNNYFKVLNLNKHQVRAH